MRFEHLEYGRGNPPGNSWSEKMIAWSMRVIANDQRENRLFWSRAQEGSQWRATFRVVSRAEPLRQPWEEEVTYTGAAFRAKRDAKEDARRLLLQAQQRAGRVPELLPPGPPAGVQQAARDGAQPAVPERPRPQRVVPIAKAPAPNAADAPPDLPLSPPPAPGSGSGLSFGPPPPEGNSEPPAGAPEDARQSEARLAPGSPAPDEPGALAARFFFPTAEPPTPPGRISASRTMIPNGRTRRIGCRRRTRGQRPRALRPRSRRAWPWPMPCCPIVTQSRTRPSRRSPAARSPPPVPMQDSAPAGGVGAAWVAGIARPAAWLAGLAPQTWAAGRAEADEEAKAPSPK